MVKDQVENYSYLDGFDKSNCRIHPKGKVDKL
jgi:hypothetical protein